MRTAVPVMLVSFLVLVPSAGADGPELATGRIDFGAWRAEAAATGPALWIPEDNLEDLDARDDRHHIARPNEWIEFDAPAFDPYPFATDTLFELVQNSLPLFSQVEGTWVLPEAGALRFAAPVSEVAAVRRSAQDWLLSIAPSVDVRATLRAQDGEGEVLASGSTRLWPGRWTKVYLSHHRVPSVVAFDLEVAQESTVMNPRVVEMPEGRELYARFHPGEDVSLVEVWGGALQIVDSTRIDLSEIRNVPEASGPATITLPQTSVKRSFTALAMPAREASTRQLRWVGPGGPTLLDLRFEPSSRPTAPPAPRHQALRIGAVGAALAFETRASATDAVVDRLQRHADLGTSLLSQEIAVLDGDPAAIDAARRRIAADEADLGSPEVVLRLLLVPEASARGGIGDGSLRPGRAVAAATLAAFHEAGASEGWSVRMPVLAGVPAAFRTGTSVAGLCDVDVEVAQASAGSVPVTLARFAGLAGTVTVDRTPAGHRLRVAAHYAWADPESGTMDLVFRPPVTMSIAKNEYVEEPDLRRRVRLPLLGGGRADLSAAADVPAGTTDEVLVSLCVRGGEVVLLLASVR